MRYFLLSIIFISSFVTSVSSNELSLDDRLVEIIVTYQTHNEIMPWRANPPGTRYGYAIFLDQNTLITTETLVRNNHLIEIRKARTGNKISAVVKMSDPQVNLALLNIDQPQTSITPLEICKKLPIDSPLKIVQFDETSQIQHSMATVLHAKMAKLPQAPYNALTFELLVDIEINGDGTAVLHEDQLAGIVMSYDRSARTASMITYATIDSFLKRASTLPYPGFARAGFNWEPLLDPAKREYLKVTDPETGILVLSCAPGTGAYDTLKPADVIIEWDGHKIDNLGFYIDQEFGRISFVRLIKDKKATGETSNIVVVRDGKTIPVSVQLSHITDDQSLVPENVTGAKADYIIEGGLIIREMTASYLHAYGSRWERQLNARLVRNYYDQTVKPDELDKKIVILVRVLPDPINIGYQRLNNLAITKVNGQPINNLKDVLRIAQKDGAITRITTDLLGVDIVLDKDELDIANNRIAASYRIPTLRYQKPDNKSQ